MQKKYHTIVLFFFLISIGWSQNTFIPDNNFEQALIDLGLDSPPLNNFVPTANIISVTNLDIENKGILDLTGIEDFNNLTVLSCSNNNLTSLNVTNNLRLKQLFFSFNQIQNIDITKNLELIIFWCDNNELTNINVSNNLNLISLITSNNPIEDLDVSNNLNLNVLVCENNLLTNLNITNNTALTRLDCANNQLTTINTTNNTNLTSINCSNNLINALNFSNNASLQRLVTTTNELTELDVSSNRSLLNLDFEDNQINTINISNNRNLVELKANRNLLETLNTSTNLDLLVINCDFNALTELDITTNNKLKALSCANNLLCIINAKNGNPTNLTVFNAINNLDLTCIIVDDINYSNTNWILRDAVATFYNAVTNCNIIPDVDILNDFIGLNYTLPILTNGNYYTQPGGNGTNLNAGTVITTTQTVYIYKETGCANNGSSFNVLITENPYFIPKYFTPNNDGTHDYWKVFDSTNTISNVYIFNRFGKLLKNLDINSMGWDGVYKGALLPNSDYWYTITFNSGKILRGHFALKR